MNTAVLAELWPASREDRPLALLFGPSIHGGQIKTRKVFVLQDGPHPTLLDCVIFDAEGQSHTCKVSGETPLEYGLWTDEEEPFTYEVQS